MGTCRFFDGVIFIFFIMDIAFTVLLFLFVLSVVVMVHEWGHFIVCRRNGIRVEEFSFGLPPRAKVLWTDRHGTKFCLGWIPLGGYVRPLGEDEEGTAKQPGSFGSKSVWVRMRMVLAGIVMNFVLAFALLWGLYMVGTQPIFLSEEDYIGAVERQEVHVVHKGIQVSEVQRDGAASAAGFVAGDVIVRFEGEEMPTMKRLLEVSDGLKGQEVVYGLLRDGEVVDVRLRLSDEGRIGVTIADITSMDDVKYPPVKAFGIAAYQTVRLTEYSVRSFGSLLGSLVAGDGIPEDIGGPVRIAFIAREFLEHGFKEFLKFVAFLSVTLGAINVLPIPALDGGRFLFLLAEALLGRPVSEKWEGRIHLFGFVLLIVLAVAVTYKDVLWRISLT